MGWQNDMTEGYGEIGGYRLGRDKKRDVMKLGRDKKRDVMNHVSTLVSLFLICSIPFAIPSSKPSFKACSFI